MHKFSQLPSVRLSRSKFDWSYSRQTSFNGGDLIPIHSQEIYPGDTVELDTSSFVRFITPLSVPVMDNIFLDVQWWFVPLRLVWEHFEEFMGANRASKGIQTTKYLIPALEGGSANVSSMTNNVGSITDYMDIPISDSAAHFLDSVTSDCTALPYRAYGLIWNEWYRDENLQDPLDIPLGDGPDHLGWLSVISRPGENNHRQGILPRGKRHDYLTSCLPFPQKGPGVELSLGTTAPVVGNGLTIGLTNGTDNFGLNYVATGGYTNSLFPSGGYGATVGSSVSINNPSDGTVGVTTNPEKSGLVADLSAATSATINTLRQAIALQQFYELDARGGTRYTEIILAHFGVVSPDARLQRPEYLGGWSQPMKVNQVAQTAGATSTSALGDLGAYLTGSFSGHSFTRSFTEHGIILGIASVRAQMSYSQGIPRWQLRRTRQDFFWKTFAHLGEQEVYQAEIYALGSNGIDKDPVFGYQERYAEMRSHLNRLTGLARPYVEGSLGQLYNASQYYSSAPTLSSSFIMEPADIYDRLSAVSSGTSIHQFYGDFYFKIGYTTTAPLYGAPGLTRL
uniref:Major capsid protein n=2 Tax=unclassified Microvirus TaxID=338099 RepID=A0AAU8B6B0_9VIRU